MSEKNTIDPIVEFPNVELMLYRLAWDFSAGKMLSFEEAQSEAYYAFMQCCRTYRTGKGMKFSSWCYFKVRNHLRSELKRVYAHRGRTFLELDEELVGGKEPLSGAALEVLDDLSADAGEIVELILDTPREIIGSLPITPRELLHRVKIHFGYMNGVAVYELDSIIQEIRQRFHEVWA